MQALSTSELRSAHELYTQLFAELSQIGLDSRGATTRLAWSHETAAATGWFTETATRLGLTPTTDKNGNQWAFNQTAAAHPSAPVLVTGSHLDSVAQGGRYDGALGVVVGLVAVHILGQRVTGRSRVLTASDQTTKQASPNQAPPLAVVAFADEEGARYDTPTFGSRVMTGALDLPPILERPDRQGIALHDALMNAGLDPEQMGLDRPTIDRVQALVEVHIEQELTLASHDQPLALATQILPHGRWRFELRGASGHAGTAPMHARRDPTLPLAAAIDAARNAALRKHGFATIGRIELAPNVTNCIAAEARFWLDARAHSPQDLDHIVDAVTSAARASSQDNQIELDVTRESLTGAVVFDPELRARIAATLNEIGLQDVPMATGAGHDAAVLAAVKPTAMLFVRSQNGASHSPDELASDEDCVKAIEALTAVLADLTASPLSTLTTTDTTNRQPDHNPGA